MKVVEVNRMLEALEAQGLSTEEIAGCLDATLADSPRFVEDRDSAVFEEKIKKHFPDPVKRASIMKRLTISACNEEEEPDDADEGEKAREANFFNSQMLLAIADIFQQTDSFEEAKAKLNSLL